jgi:uncharacterized membrane protein
MTQPDVTLTDFALTVECAIFCALALRWPAANQRLRYWWVVFFASIGLGSFLGGVVHGFFAAPSPANATLWRATLLSLGVTTLATWMAGALIQLREPTATWVGRAAIAQVIVYTAIVLFVNSSFLVAIATYVPATVFLLVVMILTHGREPARPLMYGIIGLILTFVAAGVQQLRIAIHPVYFNHNALYHVIQGIALFLIFLGAGYVTASPTASRRTA